MADGTVDVTIDTNHVTQIEHDVAPPMKHAVTFPVLIDGRPCSMAIYVMVTPFDLDAGVKTERQFGAVTGRLSAMFDTVAFTIAG